MAKRKNKKQFTPRPNKYLELLSDELRGEIKGQRTVRSLDREVSEVLRQDYRIRSIPVCWGIPMDELMFSKWYVNFVRLASMPWDSFAVTESTYLPSARNDIHNTYLNDTDAPYLMMLDSDVLPPPNIIDILMDHEKHIVGGWYKSKSLKLGPLPVVYDFYTDEGKHFEWLQRQEPGSGMEMVDGMGAGCWLMSRELAEALGENPYDMERGTEDLVLCRKIKDLGYEMWVDWDIACAHMGVSWV